MPMRRKNRTIRNQVKEVNSKIKMPDAKPITAAGGVLFRIKNDGFDPLVALIYRRGVWDLPKGKQEKGEPVKKCALREVGEELGLKFWPSVESKLTETYHEYEQDGTRYGKTTHWYAMTNRNLDKERFNPQTEEGIEKVEWFSLDEAKGLVGFENLKSVLQAFEDFLSDK